MKNINLSRSSAPAHCSLARAQVALERADRTGAQLADALIKGLAGERPVTLIGTSVGARAIFACLQHLHSAGPAGVGLVENAFLMGAPVPASAAAWSRARAVVAGTLKNVFSEHDYMLRIAFRAADAGLDAGFLRDGVAGAGAVPGVANVNASRAVLSHKDYVNKAPELLRDFLHIARY